MYLILCMFVSLSKEINSVLRMCEYKLNTKLRSTGVLVLLGGLALLLSSCAMSGLMEAQTQLRTSFASGDIGRSQQLLDQFGRSVYRPQDQVLLNLELGTISYFNGNHRQSMEYFQRAEQEIDRLFGTSVERNIRAFLVNDGQLEYQGEDYEDVMLNLFNALSAIHLGDLEAATVEARRASFKLENLSIRYDGLVETLSRQDTTKTDTSPGWSRGRTNIQSSPFGHYLSYVVFSRQGREDNARIEYERFLRTFARNFPGQRFAQPTRGGAATTAAPAGRVPEAGNVMLIGFGGLSPSKESNELRIYSNNLSTYIKYAVPSLKLHPTAISRVEAVINGTQTVTLPMLDDFAATAQDVFNVRRPLIVTRAIIRSTLKHLGNQAGQRAAAREFGETGRAVAQLVGFLVTETTEVADLRSWQTMPGRVYGQTVSLPPGTHEISIRYFDRSNRIIHQQTHNLEVTAGQNLQIAETFFPG